MSIKTKKIALAKILISSSLLLSTVGLSLALTSCSKNGSGGGEPGKPHGANYLFDLKPKFLNNKGKDANESNLKFESDVKKLLDASKGYNEKFFNELDLSFENHTFEKKIDKGEKSHYEDITPTLGDVDVYYLNLDNLTKAVNFDINDEMLSKCNKIEDVKKYISFAFFNKENVAQESGEKVTKLVVQSLDEKKGDLLTFHGKEDNGDIKKDEDISKIKKATIDFSSSTFVSSLKNEGLCGLLVTFKSIEGDEKTKSIAIKFVNNNDEFKYFDSKLYEDFNKDIKDVADDYFITITEIGEKKFDEFITNKLNISNESASSSKTTFKIETIAKKVDDKWQFTTSDFFGKNPLKLSALENYLKNTFSLNLDVKKSKKQETLCFSGSSLIEKIGDEKCKYLLCSGKDSGNKYNENMVVSYHDKDGKVEIANKGDYNTYDIPFSYDKSDEFVAKITIKQLDLDFVSIDIKAKFIKLLELGSLDQVNNLINK